MGDFYKTTGVNHAARWLSEKHPDFFLHCTRIEPVLKKMTGTPARVIHHLDDTSHPRPVPDLPTVLFGPTGTGKAAPAQAHFENPIIVCRLEDLRQMAVYTGGVVQWR